MALVLEREKYISKAGIERFAYVVKGTVRGKEVKASMNPPDLGGYQILEIIFGDKNSVGLEIKPFTMKAEDGSIITGNTYMARSTDEKGNVYEIKVKPAKQSDKAILAMIVK